MTQRWNITGVVIADEWEPGTDRFRLSGPKGDGLTVNLDTYLYLPTRWFETRKIERAPDVFVEGWYTCNSGQWGTDDYYLSTESPDLKTKLECEPYTRGLWVYIYKVKTEPGEPPRLAHVGGISWQLNYEKWDIV